ncbi:hypothetical protein WAF17_06130 [Bernardetia sp. ABR2-2B]|uniref:hypothetical protein n=1 Tax=Bernardetia sp. ABR2-2B TaxID=3127472 RepID=UPI0030D498F0
MDSIFCSPCLQIKKWKKELEKDSCLKRYLPTKKLQSAGRTYIDSCKKEALFLQTLSDKYNNYRYVYLVECSKYNSLQEKINNFLYYENRRWFAKKCPITIKYGNIDNQNIISSASYFNFEVKYNLCQLLEEAIQDIKSDKSLKNYLPTREEISKQSTLLDECEYKILYFRAFKKKYNDLALNDVDTWNSAYFDNCKEWEQDYISNIISREEAMVCRKTAPLFMEYNKTDNKYKFLKKIYESDAVSLSFHLSQLKLKNCNDTMYFAYAMLSKIDSLWIDAGGMGSIYVLDKKEDFFRKLKNSKID